MSPHSNQYFDEVSHEKAQSDPFSSVQYEFAIRIGAVLIYGHPAGCITRDPRRVERKKPGHVKARKMPAWVKR
jgi:hypothetical protein